MLFPKQMTEIIIQCNDIHYKIIDKNAKIDIMKPEDRQKDGLRGEHSVPEHKLKYSDRF